MKSALSSAPTMVRIGFAQSLAYRAELLLWILTTTMPLVNLALWSSLSREGAVGRFGPREFSAYFLAALSIRHLASSWVVWELTEEIRSGTLAARLMRPVHPIFAHAMTNLGAMPLRILLFLPVAVLAAALGPGSAVDPVRWMAFAASLVGSWLIQFSMMVVVASLAFYWTSTISLWELWMLLFMVLSGYILPLELLPASLRQLTELLPFRFMLSVPASIVTGLLPASEVPRALAAEFAWAFGAMVLALGMWNAGLRRFGAVGG